MFRKILLLLITFLIFPYITKAVMETESYNYNPFEERTVKIEGVDDFTVMLLILVILVMILYKGETTLENLKKINERRLKRKRIKKEQKRIKKMLKK